MDCLEFRRAALADPQRLPAAAAAHVQGCAACKALLGRSLEFEARLADALRVAVPQGLEERVLERIAPRRAKRLLAFAASVLVAAGVALLIGTPRPDPVALAGIDFVVFEEAQSIVEARPAERGAADGAARKIGISLPAQLGEIRYICLYPFGGGLAHHLLVKTPLGKVTLLLIPGRPRASRATASARGLEASVIPAVDGSVAIVADSSRSILRTEALLRR